MHVISLLLALLGLSTATAELIELSYTYNDDAPTYKLHHPFTYKPLHKGPNKLGIWLELNDFYTSEHSGTHIDAPAHVNEYAWHLEKIPTRRLWRVPAVVVDVSKNIKADQPNYEVKVKDLEDWERSNGVMPDGSLVLIHSGWGAKVKDPSYLGLDANDHHNFPGLGKGAADWLLNHKKKHGYTLGIIGVGIDTASIDVGRSVRFPAHVGLFKQNIYAIENMANLDKLPAKGAFVTVLPVRIKGGSGAPSRIIAEVGEFNGASCTFQSTLMLVATIAAVFAKDIILS